MFVKKNRIKKLLESSSFINGYLGIFRNPTYPISKSFSDYGVRIENDKLISFRGVYGTENKIYNISNLVTISDISIDDVINNDIIFNDQSIIVKPLLRLPSHRNIISSEERANQQDRNNDRRPVGFNR
jgi:hypothetical protein